MAGDSFGKKLWRKIKPGRKSSAKSKTQNGSQHNSVATSTSSQATEPPSSFNTTVHTSPQDTSANTAIEISLKATSDQPGDATETLDKGSSLWDKAYETLKIEEPNRITQYENLLSRVLNRVGMPTLPALNETEDISEVTNQIPQDPVARRKKLKEITELGLMHMEDKKVSTTLLGHKIVLQDAVANVAGTVEWVEKHVKEAVKDLPYASIIMAGVSLVLPLLKNPTAVETANQDGFTYVTSQMRYYTAMEPLLILKDMEPDLKADFTDRLLDLYKLIIDFQIQSVIRFYRSRTKNYFRGTIKYDKWDEMMRRIKDTDVEFVSKLGTAISGSSLQQLKNLAREAENSSKVLDGLLIKMQEQTEVSRNQLSVLQKVDQHITNSQDHDCLQSLRTTDPRHDKTRIEEAKGGLLKDSYLWVLENDDFKQWHKNQESQLLWIKGDPGKGKTMLLCGIIDELTKLNPDTTSVSFFFCQATDVRINNATAVLRGLIYLLVENQPSLISHVRPRYDQARKQLFEDVNAWIALSEIFTDILEDPELQSIYLVIDALDECLVDLPLLLNLIVRKSSISGRVKWIISSRNWPNIEETLNAAAQKIRLCLELNEKSISSAVDSYIWAKVDELAQAKNLDLKTKDDVRHHLSSNANNTFLWVALVCQELKRTSRLRVRARLDFFPPGLDSLYQRMLDQIRHSDEAALCKQILAVVSTVYKPITLEELTSFIDIPESAVEDYESLIEIIGLCGSFLTLRERTIFFVHQSAKDFMLKEAANEIFPSGIEEMHHMIFSRSLKVTARSLRRDIYGLNAPGFSIDEFRMPEPDPLAAVRYSCIYWVDHLCDSKSNSDTNCDNLQHENTVNTFLREKYLYWLEALGLCKSLSKGILSLTKLLALFQKPGNIPQLAAFVQDARRFIMFHKLAIESSPLQAYASALVFSPSRSLVKMLFQKEIPDWVVIKPDEPDNWTGCLQTLEGHSHWVSSVAFSPDSKLVASASDDKTVRIWSAETGACQQTLEGHSDRVSSVAFSPDSKLVASASDDKTVRIWSAETGACQQTLEGHSDWVSSVAFSPDSKLVASASYDKTVRIWSAETGACQQTLKGHSHWVSSVAYPNGLYLRTDVGAISLERPISTVDTLVRSGYGISRDGCWITTNGRNLLWIPANYRPSSSTIFHSTVVIGTGSGKVIIVRFSTKAPRF